MARKIAKRKPKTKTVVKYRTRHVPIKKRKRRTVGRRSPKLTQAKTSMLAPIVGSTISGLVKGFTGIDEFIEKTPLLKHLGYDLSVAIVLILLGSVSNKHRKMLYGAATGPACIGIDKLVTTLTTLAKVSGTTSGFYSDELSDELSSDI